MPLGYSVTHNNLKITILEFFYIADDGGLFAILEENHRWSRVNMQIEAVGGPNQTYRYNTKDFRLVGERGLSSMTTGCWPLMETWVQVNSSEAANCRPVSSAKSIKMTPTWSLSFRPALRGLVTWLLSPGRRGKCAPHIRRQTSSPQASWLHPGHRQLPLASRYAPRRGALHQTQLASNSQSCCIVGPRCAVQRDAARSSNCQRPRGGNSRAEPAPSKLGRRLKPRFGRSIRPPSGMACAYSESSVDQRNDG